MAKTKPSIDELCINTIRTLAMDAVEAAQSGHPGAPMGLAHALSFGAESPLSKRGWHL